MNKQEYNNLYQACRRLADGPDNRMSHYARNLINTALDFQMKVEVVLEAEKFYLENVGYESHGYLKREVEYFPNTRKGNIRLARHLWSTNHWTRAKFLRMLLVEFENRGIRGQKSLERWVREADFDRDVKRQFCIKYRNGNRTGYHSMGLTLFHWLCLRCGIDTVKPDTHILNFVSTCIGRRSNPKEAAKYLTRIAEEQGREARLLDSAIWHSQRDRE